MFADQESIVFHLFVGFDLVMVDQSGDVMSSTAEAGDGTENFPPKTFTPSYTFHA